MTDANTFDVGAMVVVYNFAIGVLLVLAADKVGKLLASSRERGSHLIALATRSLGAAVAVLSGTLYVFVYWLRIAV